MIFITIKNVFRNQAGCTICDPIHRRKAQLHIEIFLGSKKRGVLTFFQKSEFNLSESEFWIVKFYDSKIIPYFKYISSSKELMPYGCSFSDRRLMLGSSAFGKVVELEQIIWDFLEKSADRIHLGLTSGHSAVCMRDEERVFGSSNRDIH